jgi:hypothetical protein
MGRFAPQMAMIATTTRSCDIFREAVSNFFRKLLIGMRAASGLSGKSAVGRC